MENVLQNVIDLYGRRGSPPIEQVAEMADLAPSTVQRYLSGTVKRPDYSKIVALERALGSEEDGTPDIDPAIIRQIEDPGALRSLVLQLRQINIDELADNDEKWRERIDALERGHREEILRITQLHSERVEHTQRAHDAQLARAEEAAREQVRQLQGGHTAQLDIMRELVTAQKAADELSKKYLKGQILFWRIFSLLLIAAFILLLIVDVINPSRGWIRFITESRMSWLT